MTMDPQSFRIEGIYQQRQEGYFMQRVKLAAGVISSEQACCVATVADRFGRGCVHLTSRGSMEVHWLTESDLHLVKDEFARTGLTSRGACGGAVRGITCSSQGTGEFPRLALLAGRLQQHFTGKPHFEGLPKKFKIGVEADTSSGRHLIQDAGLVLATAVAGVATYDVWIAGGLGRAPRPGFLLTEGVSEERLIPVIEAVVAVYARLAPPPKRLKFLAQELGEERLRREIEAEPAFSTLLPPEMSINDNQPPASGLRLTVPVFAGQLSSARLRELATFARRHGGGVLRVSCEQEIDLVLTADADADCAARELNTMTKTAAATAAPAAFRICPGSHECRMGLAATRDIARTLQSVMSPASLELTWALSGCPNSCSQPQLAAMGIVVSKLVSGEAANREPRFDLYCRRDMGLGEKVQQELTLAELTELVRQFSG